MSQTDCIHMYYAICLIINFIIAMCCVYISHTGDIAGAIRNYTDIHFGLYYSLYEWFHPLWVEDKANNYSTQNYVEVSYSVH